MFFNLKKRFAWFDCTTKATIASTLVEISQNPSTDVLSLSLFMVQNTICRCNYHISPLTCRENTRFVAFNIFGTNVLPVRKGFTILNPALKFYSNSTHPMRFKHFKIFDITSTFHDIEIIDHEERHGLELNLGEASLLCVHHLSQRLVQYSHPHCCLSLAPSLGVEDLEHTIQVLRLWMLFQTLGRWRFPTELWVASGQANFGLGKA